MNGEIHRNDESRSVAELSSVPANLIVHLRRLCLRDREPPYLCHLRHLRMHFQSVASVSSADAFPICVICVICTNVVRDDPDRALFQIPADYTVKEMMPGKPSPMWQQ